MNFLFIFSFSLLFSLARALSSREQRSSKKAPLPPLAADHPCQRTSIAERVRQPAAAAAAAQQQQKKNFNVFRPCCRHLCGRCRPRRQGRRRGGRGQARGRHRRGQGAREDGKEEEWVGGGRETKKKEKRFRCDGSMAIDRMIERLFFFSSLFTCPEDHRVDPQWRACCSRASSSISSEERMKRRCLERETEERQSFLLLFFFCACAMGFFRCSAFDLPFLSLVAPPPLSRAPSPPRKQRCAHIKSHHLTPTHFNPKFQKNR